MHIKYSLPPLLLPRKFMQGFLLVLLISAIPLAFAFPVPASIITSSQDGKDQYVQYKVSKPVLEFDSSFNQPQQGGNAQQDPSVGFDGDVYYSNARPFWEEPGFEFNQKPPASGATNQ